MWNLFLPFLFLAFFNPCIFSSNLVKSLGKRWQRQVASWEIPCFVLSSPPLILFTSHSTLTFYTFLLPTYTFSYLSKQLYTCTIIYYQCTNLTLMLITSTLFLLPLLYSFPAHFPSPASTSLERLRKPSDTFLQLPPNTKLLSANILQHWDFLYFLQGFLSFISISVICYHDFHDFYNNFLLISSRISIPVILRLVLYW